MANYILEPSTGKFRKVEAAAGGAGTGINDGDWDWVDPAEYKDPASGGGIGGTTGTDDERLLRADGAGGATAQASSATLSDAGHLGLVGNLQLDAGKGVKVDGVQVVGDQQAAIADLTDSSGGTDADEVEEITGSFASNVARLNNNFAAIVADIEALKAAGRAHGLIDT